MGHPAVQHQYAPAPVGQTGRIRGCYPAGTKAARQLGSLPFASLRPMAGSPGRGQSINVRLVPSARWLAIVADTVLSLANPVRWQNPTNSDYLSVSEKRG